MGLTGGDKLKEKLKEITESAKDKQLKIGILEGATNSDGEPIAPYAADMEYGSKEAPMRPFMRKTVLKHKKEWSDKIAHLIEKLGYDFESSLQIVGDIASKDMMEMVQTYPKTQPNSDATIALKKEAGYNPYDQPLVASGDMMRAISFEVGPNGS